MMFVNFRKTGFMSFSSGPTRQRNVKKDDVKVGAVVGKEADASAGGQNVIKVQEVKSRERSGEFVLKYLIDCGADATIQVILIVDPCCGLVDDMNVRCTERKI